MRTKTLNALDQILDTNNVDNVILFCPCGEGIEFEQVAIIPCGGNVYVILKPVEKIEGIGDDEAPLFLIKEENGEFFFSEVNCKYTKDTVFEIYTKMWHEKRNRYGSRQVH